MKGKLARRNINVCIDDPLKPEIRALLELHLSDMAGHSPSESVHTLDATALTASEVTFWAAWEDLQLLGCGAIKTLTPEHGEIKSMHTVDAQRRRGVAQTILCKLLSCARHRGYQRLSLETGSARVFAAARRLYLKNAFVECEPFGDYEADPHSVFMTRQL